MRTLVLGGTGFLGVAACKELMRRGVETIAAGRRPQPYGTFTSHRALDRRDERQLAAVLAEVRPDVLLDLACFGPEEVEAVFRHFTGDRYIFVSTGVYPPLHGRPAREEDFIPNPGEPPRVLVDDPMADIPLYFERKRWCETVLSRNPEFPWTVVRPPAVFGAADPSLRIAAYIQRVEDGGPVLLPEESYERQAGLAWVRDLGYACALACDPSLAVEHKAYNIAFDGVSVRRLVEGLAGALGRPVSIVPIPFARLPPGASPYGPDPQRSAGYVLDRARAELGFEPSTLEEALAETLAWYQAARPSHPGYAGRELELELARGLGWSAQDRA